MRKIIVLSFITLDGVMQAPGGPEEDKSGGFQFGGWVAPYFDDEAGRVMEGQMKPADLLLGRKTFEIWESYWPVHADLWPGINDAIKYVMSTTRQKSDWDNTVFLSEVDDIRRLKGSTGTDIQVHGSGNLIQTLMQNDLVNEFWLKIFPITVGSGKKLFAEGTIPAAFKLRESHVMKSGVIFANYQRSGEVRTGSI